MLSGIDMYIFLEMSDEIMFVEEFVLKKCFDRLHK